MTQFVEQLIEFSYHISAVSHLQGGTVGSFSSLIYSHEVWEILRYLACIKESPSPWRSKRGISSAVLVTLSTWFSRKREVLADFQAINIQWFLSYQCDIPECGPGKSWEALKSRTCWSQYTTESSFLLGWRAALAGGGLLSGRSLHRYGFSCRLPSPKMLRFHYSTQNVKALPLLLFSFSFMSDSFASPWTIAC